MFMFYDFDTIVNNLETTNKKYLIDDAGYITNLLCPLIERLSFYIVTRYTLLKLYIHSRLHVDYNSDMYHKCHFGSMFLLYS